MYESFYKLKAIKRKAVLNAAIDEFVQYGFEKASTNSIAQEAGISKGSLFNYFKNKKQLFIYLIDYAITVIEKLYDQIDLSEKDLFKRLENIGLQKLEIQSAHPNIFDFLKTIKQEDSNQVKDFIDSKFDSLTNEGLNLIYKGVDYTKFRDDIDIEKAIEVLNWTMFGFSERALKNLDTFKHMDEVGKKYMNEWQAYSDFLKKLFYK